MLKNLPAYLAWSKKAVINVLGLLTTVLSLGLLPEPYSVWVTTAIVILTAISHWFAENAPEPGQGEALPAVPEENAEVPPEWQPAALVTAGQIAAAKKTEAPPNT